MPIFFDEETGFDDFGLGEPYRQPRVRDFFLDYRPAVRSVDSALSVGTSVAGLPFPGIFSKLFNDVVFTNLALNRYYKDVFQPAGRTDQDSKYSLMRTFQRDDDSSRYYYLFPYDSKFKPGQPGFFTAENLDQYRNFVRRLATDYANDFQKHFSAGERPNLAGILNLYRSNSFSALRDLLKPYIEVVSLPGVAAQITENIRKLGPVPFVAGDVLPKDHIDKVADIIREGLRDKFPALTALSGVYIPAGGDPSKDFSLKNPKSFTVESGFDDNTIQGMARAFIASQIRQAANGEDDPDALSYLLRAYIRKFFKQSLPDEDYALNRHYLMTPKQVFDAVEDVQKKLFDYEAKADLKMFLAQFPAGKMRGLAENLWNFARAVPPFLLLALLLALSSYYIERRYGKELDDSKKKKKKRKTTSPMPPETDDKTTRDSDRDIGKTAGFGPMFPVLKKTSSASVAAASRSLQRIVRHWGSCPI